MRRKSYVPAALLALLVLLGLLAFVPQVFSSLFPLGRPPTTSSAGSPAESAEGELPHGNSGESPSDPSSLPRQAVDDLPSQNVMTVRVIEAANGEPAPGAIVSYYEDSRRDLPEQIQRGYELSSWDLEWLCQRIGSTVIADQNGLARLPVERAIRVAGRHGLLYGETLLRAPTEPGVASMHVLELDRDLTFTVRVMDATGSPASNVSLRVWCFDADGRRVFSFPKGTTSESGTATLAHLQNSIRSQEEILLFRGQSTDSERRAYVLRPLIPGLVEGGTPFTLDQDPAVPIVVQLPPTGTVRVLLFGPDGTERSVVPVPVLLSIHSFTAEFGGVRRPWPVGICWRDDDRMAGPVLARLRDDLGVDAGDNLPYALDPAEDYTLIEQGLRRGLAHLMVELSQDEVGDAAGAARWAEILAGAITRALADDRVREVRHYW